MKLFRRTRPGEMLDPEKCGVTPRDRKFLFLKFRACERPPESPVQVLSVIKEMESAWILLPDGIRSKASEEAFRKGGLNTPVTRLLVKRFRMAWEEPLKYLQSTNLWIGWTLALNFPLLLLFFMRPAKPGLADTVMTLSLCIPALMLNLWIGKVLKRISERRSAGVRCLGPLAPLGLSYLLSLVEEMTGSPSQNDAGGA